MTLLKIHVFWDVGPFRLVCIYLLIFGSVLKPVALHSQKFKKTVLLGPKIKTLRSI
jgi:hypothetical protein